LLDVTPLSLGIETLGGVFTKLIERNTTIPTKKTETFTTAEDSQTSVDVHVLQGERGMAVYNKTIGRFRLDGIPPAPRGIPQIEVTFDTDANGILNVSAKDLATNKEQKITITASSGLSDQEIDQMVKDAESNAAEDQQKREEVEVRNNADSLVYQTEKNLGEFGEKLSEDIKPRVQTGVERVKSALAGTDIEEIKSASDALTQIWHEASSQLYQQTASQQQEQAQEQYGAAPTEEGEPKQPDEEVIDADYEVVDDDKK